jgi:hypothetical protein
MVGFIAFDFALRIILRCTVSVNFIVEIFGMNLCNPAAYMAGP